MSDIKQALRDFVATSNSGKYSTEDEILSKFPELQGYDRQLLRDFVATSNSGKYATEDEVFSKFPEFNDGVKKKGQSSSGSNQTQPGSGSNNAQSSQDEYLRRAKEAGWQTTGEYKRAGHRYKVNVPEEELFSILEDPLNAPFQNESIRPTKRLENWYEENPLPRYPTSKDLAPEYLRKEAEQEAAGKLDTSKLNEYEKQQYQTVQQTKKDLDKKVAEREEKLVEEGFNRPEGTDAFLHYYYTNKDKINDVDYDKAKSTLSEFKKSLIEKYGPNFDVSQMDPEESKIYDQLSNNVIATEDRILSDYINSLRATGQNNEVVEKYDKIMEERKNHPSDSYETFVGMDGVLRKRPKGDDQYYQFGSKSAVKKDRGFAEDEMFLRDLEERAIKFRRDAKIKKLGKYQVDKPWSQFYNDIEPQYNKLQDINNQIEKLDQDFKNGNISQEEAQKRFDALKSKAEEVNTNINTAKQSYNISDNDIQQYDALINSYNEESSLLDANQKKRPYLQELEYSDKLKAEKRYKELQKGATGSSLLISANYGLQSFTNQLLFESMKAAKPLGEAMNLGQDSYDWSDYLYDTASAYQKASHAASGFEKPSEAMASKYESDMPELYGGDGSIPLSSALMVNLSNGLGSAFAFMAPGGVVGKAGKGASMAAKITNQALRKGGMFLQLENSNYERNLNAGMSADDAAELSILQTLQDVAAESFFDEASIFTPKGRSAGFLTALSQGKSAREAFKIGMNYTVDAGKSILKSSASEAVEEGLGQLSQDVGAKEAEFIYGNRNFGNVFEFKAYANSMLAGALTGGFLDAVNTAKPLSPTALDAINYAGMNAGEIMQQIAVMQNDGKIDEKTYKKIEEQLTKLKSLSESSAITPGFNELSKADQNAFVATMYQLDQLKANTKTLGIETNKSRQMRTLLEQRATNILEGKRSTDEGSQMFRTYMDRNLQDMGVAVVDIQEDGGFKLYLDPKTTGENKKEVIEKATAYIKNKIKNDAIVAAKFQPKIKENAVQESSTEEVLPREQGATSETGGQPQGVGQSVQGQEVTQESGQEVSQEGLTEEQRIKQEAADIVAGLNAPNMLASTIYPVIGEVEAQMDNGEFVSDEKSTEAQDKLYELLGDIDSREDLTPEQKKQMSAVIENRIQKIQDYDYRTRTETSTTTQSVAAGVSPKTQKSNERAKTPIRTVAEEGVDVTYDGRPGRIELRDGQYVFVPKKLGAVQARPIVIGEAAQVNADSRFAGVENPTQGPNNSVANITLPNGSTLSILNDDLSIDVGLEIAKQEIGPAPQSLFDTVFEEIVTENKVEVPYLRETKPVQEQAATTQQAKEEVTPEATQEAQPQQRKEEKKPYTGTDVEARQLKEKYKADSLKRRILDQAQRIASALGNNTQVYIYETTEEYNKAIAERLGEEQKQSTIGRFIYGDGVSEIHIDLSKANERTLPHEAVHAVLYKAFGDNQKLFQQFKDKLKPILAKSTVEALENFANQDSYIAEGTTAEEFMAELGGAMTAAGTRIPKNTLQKIAQLLNEFLSKITGGRFSPITTGEVIDLFNSMADSFASGKTISINELGLHGVINAKKAVKSKSSITGEIKRFPINPNTKVEENVPLERFDGKLTNLFESDRMIGGFIGDTEGNILFKFFGGVYYPIITGKWWASRNKTKARAIAENGNKNRDADGYTYSAPMIGSDKQHMSNIDMLNVTVELMKFDANKKSSKVKKSDVIAYIDKAFSNKNVEGKKNVVKAVLKKSNTINDLFNELEFVLFQEGNNILDRNGNPILDSNKKPISNFTFEERLGIVNSILGDPKVKDARFPSAGSITEAAKRFEEPITGKAKKIGDLVTIMRTKGILKNKTSNPNDNFYHKSYPEEIYAENEDGSPAEIEVFVLDGAYSLDKVLPLLTQSSGKEFTWDEYISKHKSDNLAIAQYNRTAKLSSASGKLKSKSRIINNELSKASVTTQVSNTTGSYVKAATILNNIGIKGKVLDYGAGLGLGTDAMSTVLGDRVDSFEINPERWKGKNNVTYTKSEDIKNKYNGIVSLNVINVVPKEVRDFIIEDIFDHLEDGGTAVISSRKFKGDIDGAKNFELGPEEKSYIVKRKANGKIIDVYQKGFDGNELVDYIKDLLGNNADIVKDNSFGAAGVIITKKSNLKSKSQVTEKQISSLSKEDQNELLKDTSVLNIDGQTIFYHASDKDRKGRLEPREARAYGKGVYFASDKEAAEFAFGNKTTEAALNLSNVVEDGTKSFKPLQQLSLEKAGRDIDDSEAFNDIDKKYVTEAANELGIDGIISSGQYGYEIVVLDDSKILYEEDIPSFIANEYNDISNDELIKSVDNKLKSKSQTTTVYNASPKEVSELGKRSGVAYFATNKREADEYARMNRGEVREFNIPNSDIQPEEVVIDKINELGLKPKDSSFSVDESSLFELIDDRFENSLSKSDIDKLFNALKKDGVKAFEYTDETQVVGGLTTSIAVIDNQYIQELSTGLKSKSQVIPKATTESKSVVSELEMASNKTGIAKENAVKRFIEKYGEKGVVAKEISDKFDKIQEELGITKICNI